MIIEKMKWTIKGRIHMILIVNGASVSITAILSFN